LGYAYVNFHSVVDAERALDTLNNLSIAGKPCRIMWSQRDPSIRKTGVGNIFIKNLSSKIGHKELYDTFSAFGNILSCKVALDEKGNSKGYGFVHFENQQCAEQAVQMVNDNLLLGKKVYVGPFIPRRIRVQQLEKSWTNVFIKDLDPSLTDADLRQAFSPYGTVTSAVVMTHKEDNTSLGFGFVNYSDHESAVKAVAAMHQQKLGSKVLYCCRAQKKAERQAKLRKEWEQLKISKYQGINLYIKNLEDEVDEEKLRKEFSVHGVIKSCKIMMDEEKGISKGFGFVCFSTPEESTKAMQAMNGFVLPGCTKPLYVVMHEPKEIRRHKLTQNAYKGMKAFLPQGPGGPMYTPGQVYYQPGTNLQQQLIYPHTQVLSGMPRGWNTAQYPVPYSANNVLPRGGPAPTSSANNSSRNRPTGGAPRTTTAGAGGRGAARRPPQQVAPAPEAVSPAENVPMGIVKTLPLEQQKLYIGERLYALILPVQPQLAGKITGMFLESGWPIEDLYELLTDDAKLTEKIEDALSVLDRAGEREQSGESEEHQGA
jgi:polyadenylate-binding protein